MELNYTYNTYDNLATFAPVAVLVAGLITGIILFVITFCCCYNGNDALTNLAYHALGNVYGVHLKKDADNNYKLYSNKVPCFRLQLPLLFIMYIFTLFCSTATFVSEFFVDESSQCDVNLDCFAIDSTGSPIHQHPLSNNCTEFKEGGYSIKCFRFALDYVSGISIAGGVMVIGSLLMNIQAAA